MTSLKFFLFILMLTINLKIVKCYNEIYHSDNSKSYSLNINSINNNKTPNVYVLIVGISKYSVPDFYVNDLEYCDDDAKAIYEFLCTPEGGKINKSNMVLLTDKSATKDNIIYEAKKLFSKADENDRVLFYFSGHGAPSFFLAYDGLLSHDDLKEIISDCKAKTKICIADACHSGTWDKKIKVITKDFSEEQILEMYNSALLSSISGLGLIMSSAKDEISIESPEYKQGLFTYYLLKALKGKADENDDHYITIVEIFNYVKKNVVNDAAKLNKSQTPQLNGNIDADAVLSIKSDTTELVKYKDLDDGLFAIMNENKTLYYIKIPITAITFCAYSQDPNSIGDGSAFFLDNLIDKELFLRNLADYINKCKNENRKLIISADDGSNKWMMNNKIKFGTTISNLKPLKVCTLWHPFDETTYQVMGCIEY